MKALAVTMEGTLGDDLRAATKSLFALAFVLRLRPTNPTVETFLDSLDISHKEK